MLLLMLFCVYYRPPPQDFGVVEFATTLGVADSRKLQACARSASPVAVGLPVDALIPI